MKVGDLVQTDDYGMWTGGRIGIVVKIQDAVYCRGAFVFMDIGVHLVRVTNLRVISETR